MAAVDYQGIRTGIRAAIQARGSLSGVTVLIEPEIVHAIDLAPCVTVTLTGREAPEDEQQLRAGQSTVYNVAATLAVIHFSMVGRDEAVRLRDAILGEVELALMADRTLGGVVQGLWLDGGPMEVERAGEGPFYAAAAIEVTCRTKAVL